MKPKSALLVPGKDFYYPEFTDDLHYECELVVRICKNGKYIHERYAHKYYDAVTVGIDFTARDLQERQKERRLPWEIAKAFDQSAAIGTFIPLDEKTSLDNLDFHLQIDGQVVQQGNSSQMLFDINQLLAYISQFFSLNIGDLIFTGTPPGVGSVTVHEHLEGYIRSEKLLDLKIR